jgi:hypothetical protein
MDPPHKKDVLTSGARARSLTAPTLADNAAADARVAEIIEATMRAHRIPTIDRGGDG